VVDRDNENLSKTGPEISRIEAELAELRPRREGRFADGLKNRLKDELSGESASSEEVTVKVPLTHYIRIAQFNAAVGGLVAGLLLGVVLGGSAVLFAVSRLEAMPAQPVQFDARSPYVELLLEDGRSLTPLERALLDQLDKEPNHGARQAEFRFPDRGLPGADRS
jgi:hypothetical protein